MCICLFYGVIITILLSVKGMLLVNNRSVEGVYKNIPTIISWKNTLDKNVPIFVYVIPRLTRLEWQPKNRVKRNSRYASQCIAKKNCQKNLHNAEILYYKIVLCKFFWTSSKNRVIRIRAIGNRVNRGMTVLIIFELTTTN